MSDPTLNDVRAWLTNSLHLRELERSAGAWAPPPREHSGHFPLAHDPVALHRLALAALEDAERMEWIEGQIETGRGVTLYHGLGYGELEHQNGCEIAPTVRAAIDRARGV